VDGRDPRPPSAKPGGRNEIRTMQHINR
jgi:hypothetical protein